MEEVQFSIDIHADRASVWNTLWQDESFRQWAGIIDPGTYMKGELRKGSEVQFISAENGYGVTSLVEEVIEGEFLLLRHRADTKDSGVQGREKDWTDGKESYQLTENNGTTTLTAAFDVPPHMEEYFQKTYPKALARIKELAEE